MRKIRRERSEIDLSGAESREPGAAERLILSLLQLVEDELLLSCPPGERASWWADIQSGKALVTFRMLDDGKCDLRVRMGADAEGC